MTEMYWFTRIGEINSVFNAMWIIPLIIAVVALIALPMLFDWLEDEDELRAMTKKAAKRLFICAVIGVIGSVFVPTKRDMYVIYGMGATLDYVKSNDKAKQLPDKVVDVLTKYLEEMESDKDK